MADTLHISELIRALEVIQLQHGDLPVFGYDSYTANEGWGDMRVYDTEGVALFVRKDAPITLDGSGKHYTFLEIGCGD